VVDTLLNLLIIKGLYTFRALLSHPQDSLHKRHLEYYVRVISVACAKIGVELSSTPILVAAN
jgi:hypothetical protein